MGYHNGPVEIVAFILPSSYREEDHRFEEGSFIITLVFRFYHSLRWFARDFRESRWMTVGLMMTTMTIGYVLGRDDGERLFPPSHTAVRVQR